MSFFNHYSAIILPLLLLAGAVAFVLRRGGQWRHWRILIAAFLALGILLVIFYPSANPGSKPGAGQPWLLEVQSPLCLGCVAMKPVVDRVEKQMRGELVVRRVDIQSSEGGALAAEYGIEMTPTFIYFGADGKEQWRSVGILDPARVRKSAGMDEAARP